MNVEFMDNGIEPLNKVEVFEKAQSIAQHARFKVQSSALDALEKEVEQVVEFDS